MSKSTINIGTLPNDGTGDTLRSGATKVNDNFSELYNLLGDSSNLYVGVGKTVVGISSTSFNVGIGSTNPSSKLQVVGDISADSYKLGSTEIVSSSGQLKNISSLDTITTATIESAVQAAPNTFVDLQIVGVSTFINGPVLIGTASSSGTQNQKLQVSGGAAFVGSGSSVGIGTTVPSSKLSVVSSGSPLSLQYTISDFTISENTFGQINVRNASSGDIASADIVLTANNGTNTTNYIDLGINNSGYSTSTWSINGANDGYLYASNGAFSIGAASDRYLSFFVGGLLSSNEKARVTSTGVGIGSTGPKSSLDVNGTTIITGIATISTLDGTNLSYSGISTVSTLSGTNLSYSGISTVSTLSGTDLSYSGISTLSILQSTHSNVSGVSSVGSGTTITNGHLEVTGIITANGYVAGQGTTNIPAFQFSAGELLSGNGTLGTIEYDGQNYYATGVTTGGRGYIPTINSFRLSSNRPTLAATGTPGVATNFFNPGVIPLVANGVYEIDFDLYFLKGVTGVTTFTLSTHSAPSSLSAVVTTTPSTGIATASAIVASPTILSIVGTALTSVGFSTIMNNATHYTKISVYLENGNVNTNALTLNIMNNNSFCIPLRGSRWKSTLLSRNTGVGVTQ